MKIELFTLLAKTLFQESEIFRVSLPTLCDLPTFYLRTLEVGKKSVRGL